MCCCRSRKKKMRCQWIGGAKPVLAAAALLVCVACSSSTRAPDRFFATFWTDITCPDPSGHGEGAIPKSGGFKQSTKPSRPLSYTFTDNSLGSVGYHVGVVRYVLAYAAHTDTPPPPCPRCRGPCSHGEPPREGRFVIPASSPLRPGGGSSVLDPDRFCHRGIDKRHAAPARACRTHMRAF